MGYESQSDSLRHMQQYGPQLEGTIRDFLGWERARVIYFQEDSLEYDLQVDCCWPNSTQPEAFVSVTYCSPDTPGHSNENKLQLKVGELLLLKSRYPDIRAVLVIGGTENSWLHYVLEVFQYIFDEVVFMWTDNAWERLRAIRETPNSIMRRHGEAWESLAQEWRAKELMEGVPIDSSLRLRTWELARTLGYSGTSPHGIPSPILRRCMQRAYERYTETNGRSGREWLNYVNQNWDALWQSRSYFNPAEAAIEIVLENGAWAYAGGLAQDVNVPSMLHSLDGEAVRRTSVSEDFVLFSQRDNIPVFIQSKSSGGGRARHGKNIQNRTKEQLTRSLLYRGRITQEGEIEIPPQDFIWIAVLDGNWGVTQRTPLKYLHMLQWAGYNYLLGADSLVDQDHNYEPFTGSDNPLVEILNSLDCCSEPDDFERSWGNWLNRRMNS